MLTQPATALTPATLEAAGPVQGGPTYYCFRCGAESGGIHQWVPCRSLLDDWAEHIGYLRLSCGCKGASRVAKLGDWITPLSLYTDPAAFPCWSEFAEANVLAVRQAIAHLAAATPAEGLAADAPSRIVHQLLAGQVPPEAAVAEIQALLAADAR